MNATVKLSLREYENLKKINDSLDSDYIVLEIFQSFPGGSTQFTNVYSKDEYLKEIKKTIDSLKKELKEEKSKTWINKLLG